MMLSLSWGSTDDGGSLAARASLGEAFENFAIPMAPWCVTRRLPSGSLSLSHFLMRHCHCVLQRHAHGVWGAGAQELASLYNREFPFSDQHPCVLVQNFPRSGMPELTGEVPLKSWAFADPSASGVAITQPDGGVALDPQDSRLTQVSYSNGMLWTGESNAFYHQQPCSAR
jgi:hypothetical protein